MDPAGLIARLEEQLRNARRVPLTSQIRLHKNEMHATLNEMRTAVSRAGLTSALPIVDQLDRLMQNANPIPLTDDVRVEPAEVQAILDQIRAAVSPATN